MTNLQQYAAEIIVNNETGETSMSQAGLARLCGVHPELISRLARGHNIERKTAEVLTPGGLQGITAYPESFIATAIAKFNPTLAADLLILGVRMTLHKIAGWEAKSPVRSLSDEEVTAIAYKALGERMYQDRFCADKPGLRNIIKFASAEYKALGSANDSLADICRLHFEVELTNGQLSSLGRYVAGEYKSWYRKDPTKETKLVDGSYRLLAVYNSTMYPTIENWLRHEGHIA